MMTVGQIIKVPRQALLDFLDRLRPEYKVIAPVPGPDGEVTFAPIESSSEITFDYVNELDPPKRFLAPQTEDLYRFELNGAKVKLEPIEFVEKQVLFGIRSCDVMGIHHMDVFFTNTYKDNYYLQRRQNTILVSLACNKPLETCFCICCGGGPYLEEHFDLQVNDLGENFLIEIGSARGLELLEKGGLTGPEATEVDLDKMWELRQRCDEQFVERAYMAKGIIQITNNRIKEELWDQMGLECFSCGGCTHLCPLCTCFDVQDRMEDGKAGIRYRCWDSCQYAGYTLEASGHNPRALTKDRIKRRFYHKMSYYYMKMDGHHGCVGCGRCVITCEAIRMLDVPAALQRFRREGQPTAAERLIGQNS